MSQSKFFISLAAVSIFAACSLKSKVETPSLPPEPVVIKKVETKVTLNKIAFGSCQHQKRPQPIWTTIWSKQPDLYIGVGDNVYASKPEDKPIADQYVMQAQVPEFKKARAEIPMIATWDDHDFGENDGGITNSEKEYAKSEFLKFFPADAEQITPVQDGIYHSFTFGKAPQDVQVILLDLRWFRSAVEENKQPKHKLDIYQPTADKKKTMLGDAQWKWLEGELAKPAKIKIIVSSLQLIADGHSFEKWGLFPHEREKMFKLISATKNKNIFVISGDRHLGEFSKINLKNWGDLYDITSSGINRTSRLEGVEENANRVGNNYLKENFGLMSLDWKAKKLSIELVDLKGETIQKEELKIK